MNLFYLPWLSSVLGPGLISIPPIINKSTTSCNDIIEDNIEKHGVKLEKTLGLYPGKSGCPLILPKQPIEARHASIVIIFWFCQDLTTVIVLDSKFCVCSDDDFWYFNFYNQCSRIKYKMPNKTCNMHRKAAVVLFGDNTIN